MEFDAEALLLGSCVKGLGAFVLNWLGLCKDTRRMLFGVGVAGGCDDQAFFPVSMQLLLW